MLGTPSQRVRVLSGAREGWSAGAYYRQELPLEGHENRLDTTHVFAGWNIVGEVERLPARDYVVDLDDFFWGVENVEALPFNLERWGRCCWRAWAITTASPELATNVKRALKVDHVMYVPTGVPKAESAYDPKGLGMWRGTNGWKRALESIKDVLPRDTVIWANEEILKGFTHRSYEPFYRYRESLKGVGRKWEIMPSYDDAFERSKSPLKWYQAAAQGVPCIVSHLPPYGPEVDDGVTGLVYHSAAEIPSLIHQLEGDAKWAEQLGRNAQEWVREKRSVEGMREKLLGILS